MHKQEERKNTNMQLYITLSLINPQNGLGDGVLYHIMNHSEILMESGKVQAYLLIYTIGCDIKNIVYCLC